MIEQNQIDLVIFFRNPGSARSSELDINNFMPNIIEAFSVDGKLYSLVDAYSIETITRPSRHMES